MLFDALPMRLRRVCVSQFASAVLWSTIAALISKGSQVVLLFFLTLLLTPPEFGQFILLQTTIITVQMFVTSGGGTVIIKYVAEFNKDAPATAGRMISLIRILFLGMSVVLIGLFGMHTEWPYPDGASVDPLGAFGFLVVLCAVAYGWVELQSALLSGLREFRVLAAVQVASSIVSLVATCGLSYRFGLLGAVSGCLLGAVLAGLGSARFVSDLLRRNSVHCQWPYWRKDVKAIWSTALPSLLSAAMWLPISWLAQYWLARQDGGLEELGVFGIASQWFALVNFLPLVACRASFPLIAEALGTQRYSTAGRLFRQGNIVAFGAAIMPGVVLIGCSPVVMDFYGFHAAAHEVTFAVMIVAALVSAGNGMASAFLLAAGYAWQLVIFNATWAATMTLFLLWSGPSGAAGLAYAYLAAHSVRSVLLYTLCRVVLGSHGQQPPLHPARP